MATLSNIITPSNVLTATNTQTLSGKTIAFGSNTLTDVASTNTAQTLTNKTLQAPNITSGLTLAGAAGTAGQVLTSAGSGALPVWSNVSSGTAQFTASGAISAGNPVLVNSNGTVSAPTVSFTPSSVGTESFVSGTTASGGFGSIVYVASVDRYVAFYAATTTGYLAARLGTPSNDGSVTWGAETTIATNNYSGLEIAACVCEGIANTVAVYAAGSSTSGIWAVSVSATAITFGAQASVGRSDNRGGIAWNKNGLIGMVTGVNGSTSFQFACAFTISGTTVTVGSQAANLSGNEPNIEYDESSGYFLIVSRAGSNTTHIQPATTTSSRVVTLFSAVSVSEGEAAPFGIKYVPSVGRCIVATRDNASLMRVFYVNMSGSTPSATGTVTFPTTINGGISIGVDTANGALSFVTRLSTGGVSTISAPINGTTIAFSSAVQITTRTANVSTGKLPFDSTRNRVLGFYAGFYAVSYRAATSTLTSENYVGVSDGSYSNGQTANIKIAGGIATGLTGITAGATMYASGTSFTTTNTGVKVGKGISPTSIIVDYA